MVVISKLVDQFNFQNTGWFFFWLLGLMLVIMLAITIERLFTIYVRANVNAEKFMQKIRKYVKDNDFKKAIDLCKSAGMRALPRVILPALEEAQSKEIVDFRAVQNAIDEATLEVIPELNIRTNYLAMIGNVSTLLGLMGTIYGLIISFEAAATAGSDPGALAAGIGVAMLTTLMGLVVAIPAIVVYTIINTKTNAIIEDIDEHAVKLIHLLTGSR